MKNLLTLLALSFFFATLGSYVFAADEATEKTEKTEKGETKAPTDEAEPDCD